jgi:hypothetical protein
VSLKHLTLSCLHAALADKLDRSVGIAAAAAASTDKLVLYQPSACVCELLCKISYCYCPCDDLLFCVAAVYRCTSCWICSQLFVQSSQIPGFVEKRLPKHPVIGIVTRGYELQRTTLRVATSRRVRQYNDPVSPTGSNRLVPQRCNGAAITVRSAACSSRTAMATLLLSCGATQCCIVCAAALQCTVKSGSCSLDLRS